MTTKLSHLSPWQHQHLQEIIAAIVTAARPEKIICYGTRTKVSEAWGCFLTAEAVQTFIACDLLIITRKDEKKNCHEILERIDYCRTPFITVSTLVHSITAVNDAIIGGNVFFNTLYKTGVVLYDGNEIPLVGPVGKSNEPDQVSKIVTRWNKWFSQGQQFLKGATYFSSAGWHDLSLFLLHQAVEHTSIALIGLYTGYRTATHNLSRLLALTRNFSPHSPPVFPKNTREEMDLFNTLARAYSDARYKEGFKVRVETVAVLIERVTAFHSQAEKLFTDKSNEIKKGAALHTSDHI